MNILAANDDGISAEGIRALYKALKKSGHNVTVIAPDTERSGYSHCLSFIDGMSLKKESADFWACGGTPADCVAAGFCGIFDKFDLVVSGINAGANLGTDLIYSGTAAAARQAVISGLPGIAFSLCGGFDFEPSANWAARNLEKLLALWNEDVFINVNFPACENIPDGINLCFPARRKYTDKFLLTESGGCFHIEFAEVSVDTEETKGSDSFAVSRGLAAVSRIAVQPSSI